MLLKQELRSGFISLIRLIVRDLYSRGMFRSVREVMGDIHPNDFSGVSNSEVIRILSELNKLKQQPEESNAN